MQSEQGSKRKREARKRAGCRAGWEGEGQKEPSSLTPNWHLVWFRSQDFILGPGEGNSFWPIYHPNNTGMEDILEEISGCLSRLHSK